MDDTERASRAEKRRRRMVLRRVSLGDVEPDLDPLGGADAISLATQLTREAWSLSGRPWPLCERSEASYRFVRGLPE